MEKKAASGIMLALILTSMLTLAFNIQSVEAEPTTWTVDDDGTADFIMIQDAINAADGGDTIFVRSGTYFEHVVVSKAVALVGESSEATIIDGSGTGTVVRVAANNVSISNFNIRNSGQDGLVPAGIFVDSAQDATVEGNTIEYNAFGILLLYATKTDIKENIVSQNSQFGLYISASTENFLNRNIIKDNPYVGLYLQDSGNNTLRGNEVTGNWFNFGVEGSSLFDYIQDIDTSNEVNGKPIYYLVNQNNVVVDSVAFLNVGYLALVNSTRVFIRNINVTDNFQGLLMAYTTYTKVQNLQALDNMFGIYLDNSHSNYFAGNVLSHLIFGFGMWLDYSNENKLIENDFANMSYGIFLWFSSRNKIHHNNFINNREQGVTLQSFNNTWDNGYPSGGNYWSDYVEKYPNAQELDDSGIWDTPYSIDENNQDNYPLKEPWTPTVPTIMAGLDINPESLNLKSERQWITAYIQLPEDYNPEDIDASTILLNGTISPILDPKYGFVTNSSEYLVDHNCDGILERMVKFDRAAVESFINNQEIRYGNVALTLTGTLFDETSFEGTGVVFVNHAGDANGDKAVNIFDILAVKSRWKTTPDSSEWVPEYDVNNDEAINIFDILAIKSNWGQTTP